ncbi:MAG TPA: aldolase/citrate lyase family protein, partial [Thermomicrobiales bacterium]|nr:aldolase/citrate lyase family protein [Thermomicrobiales bacterium]
MQRTDPIIKPVRSELSVPASDPRKIARGLASAADALFLDLEDSVAPAQKEVARDAVITALADPGWGERDRTCRINPVSTALCYRDIIALVEYAGEWLDRLVVPKVQTPADVHFVDRLLTQLEIGTGRSQRPVRLEIQIEDPVGLREIHAIAASSSRIDLLTFGQGDFAAAAGMPAVDIGLADEWDAAINGDRWLLPRQTIIFAAAAAGQRALNGSYADFRDHSGFRAYCRMSRALGFAGTWCI